MTKSKESFPTVPVAEKVAARYDLLMDLKRKHGLSNIVSFTGGEMGTKLYRAQNSQGEAVIIKTADADEALTEVQSNIHGYQQLSNLGAAEIIPQPLHVEQHHDISAIVMPDLGSNVKSSFRNGESDQFDRLLVAVATFFERTAQVDSFAQLDSISDTVGHLARFQQYLIRAGLLSPETTQTLQTLNYAAAVSDHATAFLLDFTPNNLFIGPNDKATFIDPWKQGTYLGSSLISVGQLFTSAEVVCQHGSKPQDLVNREKLVAHLTQLLKLDTEQAKVHYSLGAILQLTLSAFVRIETDPDRSRELVGQMEKLMREMKSILV